MLTLTLAIPIAGALILALSRNLSPRTARIFATLVAAGPLALLVVSWLRFRSGAVGFQQVTDVPWIPALGVGFRLGFDGISLAIATTSALLFTIAASYPVDYRGKARQYLAWILFLEAVSIGLFLALDLLLFYVFFDLSLIGMYFLIALWGHKNAHQAALKFVLYTLVGSLIMLLGFLSLALATDPLSFDMRVLIAEQPLAGGGMRASLTFLAVFIGLAIKTPMVPVHTWLPAAHVEAPAPVSAILAGVLLKMGTFGMIRIAYQMMESTFAEAAFFIAILATISIVYGALVAFGQRHIKRRIAYTSITHMGYTVLGIAVAASMASGQDEARRLALGGAALEMVAHGLITGCLFLVTGSLWQRTRSFSMDDHSGVMTRAPWLGAMAVIAALGSLGLPALAGFVAEFQIFTGALAISPALAAVALLGVVITAALFLQLLQKVFFGQPSQHVSGMTDVSAVEAIGLTALVAGAVIIGVAPDFIVSIIDDATRHILGIGG